MINRILIISLFITSGFLGLANDQIRFNGSAKQVAKVGERFRVVYEINQDADNFQSPNFGSLQVLSGPSTSTNSSVQYVNGKMTQSYSMTYTYIVQATQEGEVVISPATATVDRKQVQSNSIKIQIINTTGSQQGNTSANTNNKTKDPGVLQDDDVYIKASVSNANPFIGEQVILTYKIYTRVPVSNLMVKKLSSFQGFWSKSLLEENKQYQQDTEIINGEEYVVAVINKFAVFPQKTGKLTIEPTEMECTVQLRVQNKRKRGNDPFEDFFNDQFFNRNVKNISTIIKSNTIVVNVKSLPQEGKPMGFNGAVGDFIFSSRIDKTKLIANDALTLTYTISGKGNLELINIPNVKFPVDFESFDPKVTSDIKTNSTGISGKKKFEFLAIPRNGGDFEIMPILLSYFNPSDNKYHTLSSEKYNILVEKGEATSNGISYSSSAQEDIRFIGQDIQHIKLLPFSFSEHGKYLFLSTTFFIFLLLPIVIMIILIIIVRRMDKLKSNVGLLKNRKANKVAKTRLRSAEKYMNAEDDKAYYDEIAQALWGYIADKFSLKQSELSIETVADMLKEKGVDELVTDSFINTLNNIEFARFAPGDSSNKMASIYNESASAIMQAEKALK
ncbi:MAG: protein BatD [Bacteroidetes bacterium]|nr:protein BatD [Bacteroidota bacterium]